jgi:hypothetical protein
MKYCREKGLDSAFEIRFLRVWSPSRLYNTVSQFIRGLVPMKLPVFRTRVLTRCERDRIFFNFITDLTQIVIIFDAHTRVFTIFYSPKLVKLRKSCDKSEAYLRWKT